MKIPFLTPVQRSAFSLLGSFLFLSLIVCSCRKTKDPGNHFNDPSGYSSEVIEKWMTLEVRLFKDAKVGDLVLSPAEGHFAPLMIGEIATTAGSSRSTV